jgi:hypothetical protein
MQMTLAIEAERNNSCKESVCAVTGLGLLADLAGAAADLLGPACNGRRVFNEWNAEINTDDTHS